MAERTLSADTAALAAATLGGTDVFRLTQSGVAKKTTLSAIETHVSSNLTNNTVVVGKLAMTAQYKLVGRSTASAGAGEEITSSANMFSLLGAADYAAALALLRGSVPSFRVRKAADQTGGADNTEFQLTFDTEDYDVGGYFATNAWTPTVAGKVRLFARVAITGANTANASAYAVIKKNGTAIAYSTPALAHTTGTNTVTVCIYIEDDCAANDVYTLWALDNVSASDVTITHAAGVTYFGGSFIL